jgi:steroid 5-alpha reductase family enzyme
MFSPDIYWQGLAVVALVAMLTWLFSLKLHDVSIVDSVWSVLFMLLAFWSAAASSHWGPRSLLVLALVTVWSLRLSIYITWRNRGHGEDRRYQAIRARNQPNFAGKSLYLVFGFQALLAWVIALPLHGAILGDGTLRTADAVGAALWLIGFVFEAGGDWQLARFKSNAANRGQVMDRGFWRLTRHPNYFGEFCMWWGFYAIAAAAGAWWSFVGPALMTALLLRVSGVTLLEKDIGERRPQYAQYIRRTPAFFPGVPKRGPRA